MVSDKQQHYRWDFIGLSTDTKPTPATSENVVDGSTFYCSDTSKLYVFFKGSWYENTGTGGGGGNVKIIDASDPAQWDSKSQAPTETTIADIINNDYEIINIINMIFSEGATFGISMYLHSVYEIEDVMTGKGYTSFDTGDEEEHEPPYIQLISFTYEYDRDEYDMQMEAFPLSGTEVEANPTITGGETLLSSIKIGDTNYIVGEEPDIKKVKFTRIANNANYYRCNTSYSDLETMLGNEKFLVAYVDLGGEVGYKMFMEVSEVANIPAENPHIAFSSFYVEPLSQTAYLRSMDFYNNDYQGDEAWELKQYSISVTPVV